MLMRDLSIKMRRQQLSINSTQKWRTMIRIRKWRTEISTLIIIIVIKQVLLLYYFAPFFTYLITYYTIQEYTVHFTVVTSLIEFPILLVQQFQGEHICISASASQI